MNPEKVLRPLRAAAFATACVAVTAVGHALEGGRVAGPVALGVAFAVLFPVAVVAGGRERSGTAITAGMLGAQWVLHLLFTELGTGSAAMPAAAGHAGMAVSHSGMLSTHLGIAALAGWWLRRGEIACWRLVRRVESATVAALRGACDLLAGLAAGPPVDGRARAVPALVSEAPGCGMTSLRTRCVPRRGPPRPPRSALFGA